MKFKTTKKQMKDNYNRIIGIGYCNAQHLLNFIEPIAYSTRTEGWSCDYYDVNGVLISTGYSYIDSKNVKCDYSIIREYDNKARDIQYSNASYEDRQAQVNELLKEFIKKATL